MVTVLGHEEGVHLFVQLLTLLLLNGGKRGGDFAGNGLSVPGKGLELSFSKRNLNADLAEEIKI